MDFQLYGRVLWRFKWLVLLGLVLAVTLAAFSMLRVTSNGVAYRQSVLWSSTTRLLVTQKGFPEGRLLIQPPGQTSGTGDIADPNRLNGLAILYSELATSDPVRALMLRDGPIHGKIIATAVAVGSNNFMLPLIDVMGIANSPAGAIRLAERSATALQSYLQTEQAANNVPASDRVVAPERCRAEKGEGVQPTLEDDADRGLPRRDARDGRFGVPAREPATEEPRAGRAGSS